MRPSQDQRIFEGNVFIFYAFDIGDDINLEQVETSQALLTRPLRLSKHYKNYYTPLAIELPHPHSGSKCMSSKLHSFGVISLAYKIPFACTLDELRKRINIIDSDYREQSVIDANAIFKKIKDHIKHPRFFHLRTSYVVIQVDQNTESSVHELQEQYSNTIVALLRFETESLSEYQREEILETATGYYRGDLIVIDTDAAFIYDDDYQEILDLFEFANIQHVELQYYDRTLDNHLNKVYQREVWHLPVVKAYLPFFGTLMKDPIGDLGMVRVEISAIIERLENNIKLTGDTYVSETYSLLVEKLDLKKWKDAINAKQDIIKDIYMVYQNKIDTIREDLLSILIIVLIFIELVVGILSYFK